MDALLSGARALLNLELTPAHLAAFQTYANELRAWNEKFNLTAITDPRDIQNRRPKVCRELKAVEQKLQEALSSVTSGRLHGRKSPEKIEY